MRISSADAKAVAQIAFPGYKGRKHSVTVTERVNVYNTAWDGGTKYEFVALRREGDSWQRVSLVDERDYAIPANVMVVQHAIFCGKDMGLTYHVSPGSQFLPPPALGPAPELNEADQAVLRIHVGIKSSYRAEEYHRAGLSEEAVYATKDRLVAAGLLSRNKAGHTQATMAGKNAVR